LIQVGDEAPDFTLRDQNREEFTLSALRGKKAVLIVFYPFAFTGVCTGEVCAIQKELPRLQTDDVQVLSVSVDSPFAHKVWAQREGFEFPLLSDFWPHGAVAQAYGVFNDKAGMALRGTFLIDKQGVIRFKQIGPLTPDVLRDKILPLVRRLNG